MNFLTTAQLSKMSASDLFAHLRNNFQIPTIDDDRARFLDNLVETISDRLNDDAGERIELNNELAALRFELGGLRVLALAVEIYITPAVHASNPEPSRALLELAAKAARPQS